MREAVVVLRREPDRLEQLLDARLPLLLVAELVDLQRVADDRADPLARIQARVRILEDHLHLAAQRPQPAGAELLDRLALEDDLAGRRLEQPDDRAAERRLAAARLADEAERLALLHGEADVVDRVHARDLALQHALPDREVLLDVPDLDKRRRSPFVLTPASVLVAADRRVAVRALVVDVEPAAVEMDRRLDAVLERRLLRALLERVRAARPERAARGQR